MSFFNEPPRPRQDTPSTSRTTPAWPNEALHGGLAKAQRECPKVDVLAWFRPARPQELRPWSTPSSKHAAVEARESTGHERSKQC